MIRAILLLMFCCMEIPFAGDLLVFAPSMTKSNVLEKELESKIKTLSPRAFGRFSDFKAMVGKSQPKAVIAPMATLREMGLDHQVKLYATVNGQSFQPMVLVSIGKPLSLSATTDLSIGLVAIMDRPALKKYLERQLSKNIRPNPTTKLEDLLPLLTFQSAQAVLVTNSQAKEIKARSQADLVIQPVAFASQECLGLAVLDDSALPVLQEVEKLPRTILELLDIEGWKR